MNKEEKDEAIVNNRRVINEIMSYIASRNIQNPMYSDIRNILEEHYIKKIETSEEN